MLFRAYIPVNLINNIKLSLAFYSPDEECNRVRIECSRRPGAADITTIFLAFSLVLNHSAVFYDP